MKFSLWFFAAFLLLCLNGCSGRGMHYGLSNEQTESWKDAATRYRNCTKNLLEIELREAPQLKQLVRGHNDPQYFEKMTSNALVTKEVKEALIKHRPQQIVCRKNLIDDLGNDNQMVKMLYQKNFNSLDEIIVKVLDGKLKTVGEVNQAYVAFNDDFIERKTRLMLHSRNN